MYYCLDCTNKLLLRAPVKEEEVETRVFFCKMCQRTLPCVIRFKTYDALGKLDNDAYNNFIKLCGIELLDRWDEPQFQEEKEIFLKAFHKNKKKTF